MHSAISHKHVYCTFSLGGAFTIHGPVFYFASGQKVGNIYNLSEKGEGSEVVVSF